MRDRDGLGRLPCQSLHATSTLAPLPSLGTTNIFFPLRSVPRRFEEYQHCRTVLQPRVFQNASLQLGHGGGE